MEIRTVFATRVARYANRKAAGINLQPMVLDRFLHNFPRESIKNDVIRKLTPAHEAAIRKLWSLLM
jgi:hypothetical protein